MSTFPTGKRRTKQKGWRIDEQLAIEFTEFCGARGWNPNRQVEAALRMWLDSQGGKGGAAARKMEADQAKEGDIIRQRPASERARFSR